MAVLRRSPPECCAGVAATETTAGEHKLTTKMLKDVT